MISLFKRKPKPRNYFVSFHHSGGFGSIGITANGRFIVTEAQNYIATAYKLEDVFVLYFREFGENEHHSLEYKGEQQP